MQFSGGTLDDVLLYNAGDATWTGGNVAVVNGAAITNRLSGTFDDQTDGTFGDSGPICPTFTIEGLFIKSGGNGTTYLQMDLFNSGRVEIRNGILNVSCGFVQAGGSTAATGGTITGDVDIHGGSVEGNVPANYTVSDEVTVPRQLHRFPPPDIRNHPRGS
ncbi:MAG: hypothetical protein ACKV0T_21745 [Planctomycetales bacterium]